MKWAKFSSGVIIILMAAIATGNTKPGDVVKSYSTPFSCPTGLTWDGHYLWVADRKSDLLYKIEPRTGRVVRQFSSPGFWPLDLAWDGNYLWNIDREESKIYQIDPQTGTILRVLEAPSSNPRGLAWDGQYLWLSDGREGKIYQISPGDGTAITSIIAPTSRPNGLTFDGKYLWVSDRFRDEIYMVHPQTGDCLMILKSPAPYPNGLAWDGKFLWNVDYQSDQLYKIKIHDAQEWKVVQNERYAIIEYTHQVRNYGPGRLKNLDVYIAVPQNMARQKIVGEIQFEPAPTDMLTDQWGQKVAHFNYQNLPPQKIQNSVMKVKAKIYEIRYFIFPEQVGTLEQIPAAIKKQYLVDGEKYRVNNPYFKNIVRQVVGSEKNAYWIARKLYRYVIDQMHYELVGGWNIAPTVLRRGSGSCSEYTFVYVALCRTAGLPARYSGSVVVRGDDASLDDVFHRWAEVYLPNYGWIPVDPSGGDQKWPRGQADFFGHLSNRYLVTTRGGGDSIYLSWYYNSNENWQAEPKTMLHIETLAEWSPLKE